MNPWEKRAGEVDAPHRLTPEQAMEYDRKTMEAQDRFALWEDGYRQALREWFGAGRKIGTLPKGCGNREAHMRFWAFQMAYHHLYASVRDCTTRFVMALVCSVRPIRDPSRLSTFKADLKAAIAEKKRTMMYTSEGFLVLRKTVDEDEALELLEGEEEEEVLEV